MGGDSIIATVDDRRGGVGQFGLGGSEVIADPHGVGEAEESLRYLRVIRKGTMNIKIDPRVCSMLRRNSTA